MTRPTRETLSETLSQTRPRTRIAARFEALAAEGRAALVAFVTAGDPDPETSLAIVRALSAAGSDVIELGMPFSDPMAEGPPIQASSKRALDAGMTLRGTLDLARRFRAEDAETPLVLMGYYNPIYSYGVERFLLDAKAAGVDGLIVVDLPPEEDAELCLPAQEAGLNFIRLATPTTDEARMPAVLANTSGFVYYVSVAGVTGAGSADPADVGARVAALKARTDLPVCVGFGIKTGAQAEAIARVADGAVVGSVLVEAVREALETGADPVEAVASLVRGLSEGVRSAARG